MRKTKIMQEEFEREFWHIHDDQEYKYYVHQPLCSLFSDLGVKEEFQKFWREVNIKGHNFVSEYFGICLYRSEKVALLRLMIAQEFIEQFNNGLGE